MQVCCGYLAVYTMNESYDTLLRRRNECFILTTMRLVVVFKFLQAISQYEMKQRRIAVKAPRLKETTPETNKQ